MDQPPHRPVVTQRKQLLPAGIPRVPGAEAGGGLVGEHHEVLALVEDRLGLQLLLPGASGPGVGDQTTTGGELPELHQRVLA